jgi:DNA polymerase-3 subunit beta
MKITCDREKILAAFQTAAAVAPNRSPKPILQNVKLEVTESSAVFMATDMEVGIRIDVPGIEVETPGSVVLSVAHFGSILRESNDEKLRLEADEQGAVIRGERNEFNLPSANPHEFPEVVGFAEDKFHEVPARLFKELVRRTLFATDTESSRYALGGRRLAKMEGPAMAVNGHDTGDAMTIVPTRSMQLIERALSEDDAEIQIAARANDILVKSPRATIYSRLVEGRFPKWRDVFPAEREASQIEMTVGPTYSALRQAAIVTSPESRGIDFEFREGTLTMQGVTAEVGQAKVEIPIPYSGSEIILTMDHRFVSDFLKVLDNEKTFNIEIADSESAALLTTDDGYGYVVMPLARDR